MLNLFRNIHEARVSQEADNKLRAKRVNEEYRYKVDELLATDPAYQIGVDWSATLDKLLAGEVEPADVDGEFRDRIAAAGEQGVTSPILAAIDQQLPLITKAGHIAAFKQEIDDVLNNALESFNESQYKEGDTIEIDGKPAKITGSTGSGSDEVLDVEFEDGTGTTVAVSQLQQDAELPAGSKGNTTDVTNSDASKDVTTYEPQKVGESIDEEITNESNLQGRRVSHQTHGKGVVTSHDIKTGDVRIKIGDKTHEVKHPDETKGWKFESVETPAEFDFEKHHKAFTNSYGPLKHEGVMMRRYDTFMRDAHKKTPILSKHDYGNMMTNFFDRAGVFHEGCSLSLASKVLEGMDGSSESIELPSIFNDEYYKTRNSRLPMTTMSSYYEPKPGDDPKSRARYHEIQAIHSVPNKDMVSSHDQAAEYYRQKLGKQESYKSLSPAARILESLKAPVHESMSSICEKCGGRHMNDEACQNHA